MPEWVADGWVWVPGKLPGLNDLIDARGRGHGNGPNAWSGDGYSRMKAFWSRKVVEAARDCETAPARRPAWFSYLFVEETMRRDPSNFIGGGVKLIEDGLQEAGILANDGWKDILGIVPMWTKGPVPGVLVVFGDGPRSLFSMQEMLDGICQEARSQGAGRYGVGAEHHAARRNVAESPKCDPASSRLGVARLSDFRVRAKALKLRLLGAKK